MGGAGAGLTIARKIVDRYDGEMWVESSPGPAWVPPFSSQQLRQNISTNRELRLMHRNNLIVEDSDEDVYATARVVTLPSKVAGAV